MPSGIQKYFFVVGDTFNRLTIVLANPIRVRQLTGAIRWKIKCRCDCGKIVYCRPENIQNGRTKSCGCLKKELRPTIEAAINAKITQIKTGAKTRKFALTISDKIMAQLIVSPCYYCGEFNNDRKNNYDPYEGFRINGIDRIDNNKGYTITNSVPCCEICNRAKSTRSLLEFIEKIKEIYINLNLDSPTTLLDFVKKNNDDGTIRSTVATS